LAEFGSISVGISQQVRIAGGGGSVEKLAPGNWIARGRRRKMQDVLAALFGPHPGRYSSRLIARQQPHSLNALSEAVLQMARSLG
jgi:hypothetical protein